MNDQSTAGSANGASAGKEERQPPPQFAQLSNMSLAYRTMLDCTVAGHSSPRLGLFYGPSGYGKTSGAAFTGQRLDAAYVEARSVWTQKTLLKAIAEEIGVVRVARTGAEILEQIIEELRIEPRPLIIDEMDYLVKKQSVDIIRDIHDATSAPILMIGMEALPAKLKEWEQFDNRILVSTPAQPASAEDCIKLRDHYCRGSLDVADDLALYFGERCYGVTRRIVNNLKQAERLAAEDGTMLADRKWWGNRAVMTGDLQTRRRAG